MTVTELSAGLALVGAIVAGVWALDDRHAADEDVKELSGYIDQRQQQIQQNFIQQQNTVRKQFLELKIDSWTARLWRLRDRTGCVGPTAQECAFLKQAIERAERQLRN